MILSSISRKYQGMGTSGFADKITSFIYRLFQKMILKIRNNFQVKLNYERRTYPKLGPQKILG